MRSVNIGKLKNELSAYLKLVQNGEEVIVNDRNRPVAKIVPFPELNEDDEEAHLIATGQMRAPQKEMDWEEFWKLPRPTVSDEAARAAIRWAKGER